MLIETSEWGKIEVDDNKVYNFPKGIPGFEEETEFALVNFDEGPFEHLQSTRTEVLSFILVDPFLFYPDYEFDLPDSEAEELDVQEGVVVLSIVTLKEKLEHSTINLLAPVILNPLNNRAKQVVLHQSAYQTKHSLFTGISTILESGGE